jgi:hypothetical protein
MAGKESVALIFGCVRFLIDWTVCSLCHGILASMIFPEIKY